MHLKIYVTLRYSFIMPLPGIRYECRYLKSEAGSLFLGNMDIMAMSVFLL